MTKKWAILQVPQSNGTTRALHVVCMCTNNSGRCLVHPRCDKCGRAISPETETNWLCSECHQQQELRRD
jgi:RecJ-like exonuclease